MNLLNYDSYNQANYFLHSIYSLCLFSLITKRTRVSSHSATLIDNIFANIYDYAHMSGISDHFPVFTCKKVITHSCRQISMTSCYKVSNHSEVNMSKLFEKISNESWNVIYDTDNVDEACDYFIKIVLTLYNVYCPYCNVQPKNHLVNHG